MLRNEIVYTANPTPWLFHQDDSFIRGLMGPFGSGKSSACAMELLMRAMAFPACRDGVRRSRWVCVRNTKPELQDTTLQDYFDWIPKDLEGKYNIDKMNHDFYLRDNNGKVTHEVQVWFRALDKPKDIKRLLSASYSGAWINEAREFPEALLQPLRARLGRYPKKVDCPNRWKGLWMDTNPPDTDSWWYKLFEVDCPSNAKLFKQPGGLAPNAENLQYLDEDYYTNMLIGSTKSFVKVYVDGEYGWVQDGKAIYENYTDSVHCPDEIIPYDSTLPLLIGMDFGLTPAVVFLQRDRRGRWSAIDELTTTRMDVKRFAEEELKPYIGQHFAGANIEIYGDPAGADGSQQTGESCFKMVQSAGLQIMTAPDRSNALKPRISTVNECFGRLIDGIPGLRISKNCVVLRKACAGKYQYARMQTSQEKYRNVPDKNIFSHVAEALQYGLMGGGENATINYNHDTGTLRVTGGVRSGSSLYRPGKRTGHNVRSTGGVR